METFLVGLFYTILASVSASNNLPESIEYNVNGHSKVVVCYWGTWANYRLSRGKFTPEDVDPALCTHLIYSFAGLNETTSEITSLDPWMDVVRIFSSVKIMLSTNMSVFLHKYTKVILKRI